MQKNHEEEEWLCLVLEVPEVDAVPAAAAEVSEEVPADSAEVTWAEGPEAVVPADIWEAAFTATDNPLHHPQWAAEDGIIVPRAEAADAAVAAR